MANPPQEDLRPWFQSIHDQSGLIDWSAFFGNDNPVELDIGCGRGLFLFNATQQNPQVNYLGLEKDYREGRRTARRFIKWNIPNGRVIGGDCRVVMDEHIAAGSVSAAHVYFPDPWWKRRHLERRLFNKEFVHKLVRILKPGGLVHSWTDVEDYFQVISTMMEEDKRFLTLPAPEERAPEHDMDYLTSFERKARKTGGQVWRGLWQLREKLAD